MSLVQRNGLLRLAILTTTIAAHSMGQGPTWANPGAVPSARARHAMAYDQGRGRVVSFGGYDSNIQALTDTWEHDGTAWIRRTPAISPPARADAHMAYDPIRGVSMLAGGSIGTSSPIALHDAWLWDGESWTSAPGFPGTNGLPFGQSLLVWHGGANRGFVTLQQTVSSLVTVTTWRFDGATWQVANTVSAPILQPLNAPTTSGTGTWAPSTGHTYAHTANGLWSWDGTSWQTVVQSGGTLPGFALDSYMVWDEARSRLVMLLDASSPANTTWVGQLVSPLHVDWTVVSNTDPVTNVTAPSPRFFPQLVYDSRRQRPVLFGGRFNNIELDDMWTLESTPSGPKWQRQPTLAATPTDRVYTDMAFEASSGRMVLFGGNAINGPRNDTWTFDGAAWTDHGPSGLVSPRAQPALCYAPSMGTVMFGGGNYPTSYFNDTWFFSGTQWFQNFVSGAPAPRMGHDMVWASGWNCIVMYGGYNGTTLADTWSLAPGAVGVSWTPMFVQGSAGPRQSHAMAFDQRRNRVVVFGGADANGIFLGDTWELVPATLGWQWVQRSPTQSPPRRWQHKMDYDAARGVVVMTGGYGNPQCGNFCASHLDDVWEYDGDTWTQRLPATTLPPVREGAGFAYDSAHQRFVLQGGSGNGAFADETWYYTAANATFGQGMQGGSTLRLRCTRFPVAGQPTSFAFDSPFGFGWLTVFVGPAPQAGLTLGPGLLCGTGTFYGVPAIVADAMGSPGTLSFSLPASMIGQGFVTQGIALDSPFCLRLTDPLAVTIHAP